MSLVLHFVIALTLWKRIQHESISCPCFTSQLVLLFSGFSWNLNRAARPWIAMSCILKKDGPFLDVKSDWAGSVRLALCSNWPFFSVNHEGCKSPAESNAWLRSWSYPSCSKNWGPGMCRNLEDEPSSSLSCLLSFGGRFQFPLYYVFSKTQIQQVWSCCDLDVPSLCKIIVQRTFACKAFAASQGSVHRNVTVCHPWHEQRNLHQLALKG